MNMTNIFIATADDEVCKHYFNDLTVL